ncbi:transporter substrate-binding domain-containing protein [Psychrosphaera sp. 1_MG-2023]|uniref:substrate-binding periplasmic protein n=1 Tax=Psychrosphaera sp. 1_MG-2023 TaxID=3062643 RepID=UPI0026E29879|nr:transporter substrate-binding domain-containing protein [Psychrosphaera sp. 1_MG-2023]MDO6720257.1 transporter substrate-binding domain-containing protein [Psychrosphaera sp. 1_MG-2023]
MSKLFSYLVKLVLVILSFTFSQAAVADDEWVELFKLHNQTNYVAENYPPANFYKDNLLQGVSIDLLHEIWSTLSLPKKDVLVVPWVRGYRQLENTPNTVLFTMSRTKEREDLFKWVGPVFSSTHVLVAKQKTVIDIKETKDIFKYSVATVRADISEKSLRKIGFPDQKLAKLSNVKQAFLMLKNERVDLVMLSIHGLHHVLMELHELRNRYKIVWQVNKIGNYFAFSKETPDLIINKFQQTLDSLETKRIEILQKYKLPEEEY